MTELTPELRRHFFQEGKNAATTAGLSALIQILSPEQKQSFLAAFEWQIEGAQTSFLPTELPEEFFEAFEEETRHILESAEP